MSSGVDMHDDQVGALMTDEPDILLEKDKGESNSVPQPKRARVVPINIPDEPITLMLSDLHLPARDFVLPGDKHIGFAFINPFSCFFFFWMCKDMLDSAHKDRVHSAFPSLTSRFCAMAMNRLLDLNNFSDRGKLLHRAYPDLTHKKAVKRRVTELCNVLKSHQDKFAMFRVPSAHPSFRYAVDRDYLSDVQEYIKVTDEFTDDLKWECDAFWNTISDLRMKRRTLMKPKPKSEVDDEEFDSDPKAVQN